MEIEETVRKPFLKRSRQAKAGRDRYSEGAGVQRRNDRKGKGTNLLVFDTAVIYTAAETRRRETLLAIAACEVTDEVIGSRSYFGLSVSKLRTWHSGISSMSSKMCSCCLSSRYQYLAYRVDRLLSHLNSSTV